MEIIYIHLIPAETVRARDNTAREDAVIIFAHRILITQTTPHTIHTKIAHTTPINFVQGPAFIGMTRAAASRIYSRIVRPQTRPANMANAQIGR